LSDVHRRIGDAQQRQTILYSIIFQKTRQGQNKTKKKLLRIFSLSLPLEWEYDHQSAQTQALFKQNGKREISSQGQLSNPFLISYAKKSQKRLMMFKPEKQRLVMINQAF
jgi:hypothetical protein